MHASTQLQQQLQSQICEPQSESGASHLESLQALQSGKWGADAKTLFVGSGDHNLRMFASPDGAIPMEK